ncbi:methyltransferase domain-containing protein [Paenibacillus sp. MMS20-IR301]|uniref:class I SAM-dependent methyltransferase n=1 Tax=Paenibacillus sp. MMS20-IR301 TaxID=2895946 RepID=UPI0028E4DF13|nr:methyltransferase domain-containing protein [Paenibacillus sp. MMS20-IR301]WNS43116.1 methyltransferase domain-containing protein [Paenibacillus sp. MMS20-IR301]
MKSPKNVGSITPSSRFLAKKMIRQVDWNDITAVAELGSGTGPITRYIGANVKPEAKVFLFEMDHVMRKKLRLAYPEFSCHANAVRMKDTIHKNKVAQLDCIFSGLPFFNFERGLRDALIEQIVSSLKPGGLFVAFQYSLQMKKQLAEHFIIEDIKFVPLNVPPAFVYVCRKHI